MQHTHQARRVNLQFIDQQAVHLRIAVLLDHKHLAMLSQKLRNACRKRKGPQPQRIQMDDRQVTGAYLTSENLH